MYNIDTLNIGNQIKYYRTTHGHTLESLAKRINKSKSTVSKYEKNQIIPDIMTVLEICNVLDINLSEFIPSFEKKVNYSRNNPFKTNKLYLYYLTDNRYITSILEIIDDKSVPIHVRLYNGVKNINTYAFECAYYYDGILEANKNIAYINLRNTTSQEVFLEKLQITVNIPWSLDTDICNFLINGLTPNGMPVIKKGILSSTEINDFDDFKEDFSISKDELKRINQKNAWILENKDYNHFFYDIKKENMA